MRYTELFYSLQGEGKFVGVPSVFLRMFGCNLRCPHFGAHNRVGSNPEVDEVTKNIDKYQKFEDLPLVRTGCDTYASVYPQFKRFAQDSTPAELAEKILAMQPGKGEWHLVTTGGEPLLIGNQKDFATMLPILAEAGLRELTFETNGTQYLAPVLRKVIDDLGAMKFRTTFSVSPKLSSSGEDLSVTIVPENIVSYQDFGDVYLKFVVTNPEELDELTSVVQQYRDAGFTGYVYLMPAGGCIEEYQANREAIAKLCLEQGYRYSPRLHVDIWGNQ